MEFLVDFKVNIPDGTPESEVRDRDSAEAIAAGGVPALLENEEGVGSKR